MNKSLLFSLHPTKNAYDELLTCFHRGVIASKFLYWKQPLAKIYEKVLEDSALIPRYRKLPQMIPALSSMLKTNISFLGKNKASFNFISLGCGLGDVEAKLVKMFQDEGHQCNTLLLDYSEYFLGKAAERVGKVANPGTMYPIHCDFTQDPNGLLQTFIENIEADHNIFFMFGSTFGKDQPNLMLKQVEGYMKKGDYLFVDFNIFPKKEHDWMKMVMKKFQASSNKKYYIERFKYFGLPASNNSIEFLLRDNNYNEFWNMNSCDMVFKEIHNLFFNNHKIVFFPGERLSLVQYYYFKEKNIPHFFKKSGLQLITHGNPFKDHDDIYINWAVLKK